VDEKCIVSLSAKDAFDPSDDALSEVHVRFVEPPQASKELGLASPRYRKGRPQSKSNAAPSTISNKPSVLNMKSQEIIHKDLPKLVQTDGAMRVSDCIGT